MAVQDRSFLVATRTDDDPGQDERGTFLYYLFYKVILPGVTVAAAANAIVEGGGKPRRTFRAVGSPLRSSFEGARREAPTRAVEREEPFGYLAPAR